MPKIKNIGKKIEIFDGGIQLYPDQEIEVPERVAQTAYTYPWFAVDWERELPFKEKGKVKHITYHSPFHPYDGYGVVGCHTVLELERRGIDVNIQHGIHPGMKSMVSTMYPHVIHIADKPKKPTKLSLCHAVPVEMPLLKTPIRVLHTMWEATLLPESWMSGVGMADAIIVPSQGQIPIFRDSGFRSPIHVAVDPIDMDSFPLMERPQDREPFTFVSWSRMSSRKCPLELVKCFLIAFQGNKNVRLVLKTRDNELGAGYGIPSFDDKRIVIHNANWPIDKMQQLCFDADCGVFLSHGEGSYNPPVQAMATGLPVIGPNHSGCTEWSNPKYCYPVGLNKKEPYIDSILGDKGGKTLQWWQMDYDEVIETMRYIYNNQDKAREKGRKASSWVRRNFTIKQSIDQLLSVLERFD